MLRRELEERVVIGAMPAPAPDTYKYQSRVRGAMWVEMMTALMSVPKS